MNEIDSNSVDLVFAGPPYNIGTHYGENTDTLPLADYQKLLKDVFKECTRVLKDDGILVIEAADSIFCDGTYIQLAGYVQSLCIKNGMSVVARHINFAHSESGIELLEEHWGKDYTSRENSHSNCHQILVLSKSSKNVFNSNGKIMYFDYVPIAGHPCPSPEGEYKFVLDTYFSENMVVLDPFMGTAVIGAEVLKRGGSFVGYEKDLSVYIIAERNLSSA